jgi:antitoxin ParD1/3/4
MNVSLTPELERLVQRKVKSGEYQTASEVIREGLRLIKERDRQEWLRAEIQKAIDEIDRGEFIDYNNAEELANEIKAEGRRRLAAIQKRKHK